MADIELVIKIPEEDFERCKKKFQMRIDIMGDAIAKGMPLPKGHGKLIDADKEIKQFCGKVCGHTLEECGYGFCCPLVKRMISAPTIIEADKS